MAGLFGVSKIYSPTGSVVKSYESPFFEAFDIAVNSNGTIYRSNLSEVSILNSEGTPIGTLHNGPSYGVAVDPSDNHVYVDEGDQVVEYDEAGNQVGGPIGVGTLSGSVSLSADSGRLAISNVNSVVTYGPRETPKDRSYDSPLVIDSVKEAAGRHLDEFQTDSSGDDAVFPTTLPLTEFDNGGRYGLYRFDADTDQVACVSCPPTENAATADASLPGHGLGITDDGRVFFNSSDPLVLRDTNEKPDAYEWKDGEPQLISTGNSIFDSGMLSTTRSGRDAYFFTRDQLVPSDVNGQAMKVYDAREEGGFFVVPAPPPCAASDECHGPGTQAASPPPIGTFKGAGGQFESEPAKPKQCKKGFKKRKVAGKNKCVRKPHRRVRTRMGGRR